MKWNAIITKSQYAKTLLREKEISQGPVSSQDEDELQLLRILIKDYEERQLEMQSAGFQIMTVITRSGRQIFR
ncbi:MAG: hypothetical protein Q8918_12195 [Bacteroidota bacterium]|nr:hypothetical protein [Bacteroidota bacterium]MDP4250862.1 hypothetical protein [Bacteroidota bacterium]